MNDMTAGEAREQLDRATTRGLASRHDRRVHGWTLAGLALLIAVFMLAGKAIGDEQPWRTLLTVAYTVVLIVLVVRQRRSARTVPRHTRTIEIAGLIGTFVLGIVALGVVSFWDAPWVYLISALGAASPGLIGGAVIGRGGRR